VKGEVVKVQNIPFSLAQFASWRIGIVEIVKAQLKNGVHAIAVKLSK